KYVILLALVFSIAGCSKGDEESNEGENQPERTTSSTDATEPDIEFAEGLLDDAYEVKYFEHRNWDENMQPGRCLSWKGSLSEDEINEDSDYYTVLYDKRMHPTAQISYNSPVDIANIEVYTTDTSGNCTSNSLYVRGELYKSTKWEYDNKGNCTSESFYDDKGQPKRKGHDTCGTIIEQEGGPGESHKQVREFDDKGRVISERYFDENNEPTPGYFAAHEVRFTYDDADIILSESYFGLNREPITVSDHYIMEGHRLELQYGDIDGRNEIIEEAFFGIDGEPFACDDGTHRIRYEAAETFDCPCGRLDSTRYDVNGNVIHDH
ncbi:MAG: hypothetical protein GY771_17565, partial [bacterium]|nr:hypothetical protein [bacterium]